MEHSWEKELTWNLSYLYSKEMKEDLIKASRDCLLIADWMEERGYIITAQNFTLFASDLYVQSENI